MKSSKRKNDTYIPNQPFVEWLCQQIRDLGEDPDDPPPNHLFGTSARERLARRLDISVRTLYRHMNKLNGNSAPTVEVSRCSVEEMLHSAGISFYAVYPDFSHERDIELEPDAWCRCCADYVTPVSGVCLWCDTPVDEMEMAA